MYSRALPTDTPSPIFSWGERAAVHRLSGTDWILSSKDRRIVYSKLKLFHCQINTYHLSDAKHQTDNPSHTNNASLVWKRPLVLKWMSRSGLKLGVRASAFSFSQRLFLNWLLTFLRVKIISEVQYFIKSMIYQMLKFFKSSLFHPEMIRRPLFWFKDTKKYRLINI